MFTLTIEDNNGQIAEQFSFDHGSYLIGRQENCDIVLPSSSVSRKHAKLFIENSRCYIEDLNSANGVTVDGQRVVEQRHLGTAAQIQIGDYYLYVEYKGDQDLEEGEGRETLYIDDSSDHNKLVRVNDEFAGEEFSLSEVKNTIGRTDDNFILLSDPSISREHAVVTRDGGSYALSDRGSSNGTRVNGKEVVKHRKLQPGDLVEFGNVQFVFARGNEEIDPANYGSSTLGTEGVLVAGIIAVVVVVALLAGGLIVYGFSSFQDQNQAPPKSSSKSGETKVDLLMKRGRTYLEGEQWDRAIEVFNDVLSRTPGHTDAKKLRQRAKRAKKHAEFLDEGIRLSKDEKYEEALETLRNIPEDSPVYSEAEPTLLHVRKTLAYNLRSDVVPVEDLSGDQDLQDAHDKLERAASLAPADSDIGSKIGSTLDRLEREMERRGVSAD